MNKNTNEHVDNIRHAAAEAIRKTLELAYAALPEGEDLDAFDAAVWASATECSEDAPPGSPWSLESRSAAE
jgi:hypothetical protein